MGDSPDTLAPGTAGSTGAPGALQFDTADFGGKPSGSACLSCKRGGLTQYYAVNGKVLCESCKDALANKVLQDGAVHRLGATLVLGLGAAIASGVAYGLITMVSGFNLGIVSVAVGWFVGRAVSRGAGLSRGVLHQGIAVVLTYLAVCASFVPGIVHGLADRSVALSPAALFGIVVVCLEAPVRYSDILGKLIYGFALYQAYKVTQPVKLSITGPFQVSPGEPKDPARTSVG